MKTIRIHFRCAAAFAVAIFFGVTTIANGQSANRFPMIKIVDVPISVAIESLTRQSGFNYIMDPKLFTPSNDSNGNAVSEPTVTYSWTNVTAEFAISQMLNEHHLVMVEDKSTTVTQITSTNHFSNVVDANLIGSDTKNAEPLTNSLIPIIRFLDVPLDEVLENLIERGHINVVLDPKVSDYVDSNDPTINKFHHAPMVSLRWQNITAKQAIVALCENYDLVIVKDSATGVVSIKPKE